MSEKPTYRELEQRVQELERAEHKNNITDVFFNSIFEKHNAVMLLIEPNSGAIIEANIAAQNYYGYSISSLKQMKIQDINILSQDEVAEKRQQAANENVNCFEFPHRLSDGEIRMVEVHSSPIIINNKKHLLSVIHDITERKLAERALHQKHEMLKRTEAIAHVGSWDWEMATDKVTWSEELYRLFKLDPDGEAPSWAEHWKLCHPEDFEKLQHAAETAIATGAPYEIELRALLKDGETRIYKSKGFPETGKDGQVVRLYGLLQDITDRKLAENALLESVRKWRSILVNTPQIGISLDPKGRIVFANKHFLELTGWENTDVIGKDWFDMFIPEKIKEEIRHVFFSTISQKDSLEFSNVENDIVTKSGVLRSVAWSNVVTKDSQCNIVDVTCLGIDLTERKNNEILIEKKNSDLQLAQRIASIGTWTLDPEIGVPEWSEEIYRIYERDPKLGPYPLDEYKNIFKGKWWKRFHSAIQAAIADGTPYDIELKLELPTGKVKWIHAICEPEPEIGPKGHKVRGTIQNITEKKQAEEALRQSHKMEAIGTLAGGIAHEFNNMLGIIIGNTELALDDIPEWNPAADCIQEIRTAGLRAKDVVRKLLSVARKTMTSRKPLQIAVVVKESLDLLRRTLPASIDIQQNLNCTTEMISGDSTEIIQVLINLCTNSVHAMSEETGVLEVSLSPILLSEKNEIPYQGLRPGDYVRLTVKDNGEGIEPEIIDRIFEPYFTTKDIDKGLGMGLAVVHGIVKKHDGVINVKSEMEKGTTVEILFPLIDTQPVTINEKADMPSAGTESILFIDDEASLVKMVKQMLERSGYKVVGKTSSIDALNMFKERPDRFDLVISDMAMPEMAGDRLVQEIIQIRPDMKIILCTGHSNRMNERKAMSLGINAFVMKPLGIKELKQTVRKVLNETKSETQG